jgi:hypothetical protein
VVCGLLWRATAGSRTAAFRGVGWALVIVALTGPVLFPWYLVWGLFAAAVGSGLVGRLGLVSLSSAVCMAAALGSGSVVVLTWVVVTVAVLGFTGYVGRALLTDRALDSSGGSTAAERLGGGRPG